MPLATLGKALAGMGFPVGITIEDVYTTRVWWPANTALTLNEPLPRAFDPAASVPIIGPVYHTAYADNGSAREALWRARLTTGTNVQFTRTTGAALGGVMASVMVVRFGGSFILNVHDVLVSGSTQTVDVTISPGVSDVSKALVFPSQESGASEGRLRQFVKLVNPTTARFTGVFDLSHDAMHTLHILEPG